MGIWHISRFVGRKEICQFIIFTFISPSFLHACAFLAHSHLFLFSLQHRMLSTRLQSHTS
jgi:hypothetical protein